MRNNPYVSGALLGLQQSNNYRGEMWLAISSKVIVVASLAIFWNSIAPNLPNQDWRQLMVYLLVANGVKELIDANNIKFAGVMNDEIATGSISSVLLRPINPVLFVFARYTGSRGVQMILGLFFIIAGLVIAPQLSVSNFLGFSFSLIISFLVAYAINTAVGTFAFFVTQAHGLRLVIIHSIRVLGGSTIPLYFFNNKIRQILLLTPLPSLAYLPARMIQVGLTQETIQISIASFLWVFILLFISRKLWNLGLSHYESHGA